MHSASIAVYRPQAELFGGKSDGKFVLRLGKDQRCQVLISAGDDRVGVRGLPTEFATRRSQSVTLELGQNWQKLRENAALDISPKMGDTVGR